MTGLQLAARDYCWLLDRRKGITPAEIAGAWRVAEAEVLEGLERAVAMDGDPVGSREGGPGIRRVIPLFPAGPLTPFSACPHRHPITDASVVCMVCHNRDTVSAEPSDRAASRPRPERARRAGVA